MPGVPSLPFVDRRWLGNGCLDIPAFLGADALFDVVPFTCWPPTTRGCFVFRGDDRDRFVPLKTACREPEPGFLTGTD